MIPPIWFLEIHRINVKLGVDLINQTEVEELQKIIGRDLVPGTSLINKK
ncbi:unnamed protein product, partial [Rotaria magnacalcarata]